MAKDIPTKAAARPAARHATAAHALTEGQRAYEAKRAAKAGMALDKWLAEKQKQTDAAAKEAALTAQADKKAGRKPGLFSRLLDRAHKPL